MMFKQQRSRGFLMYFIDQQTPLHCQVLNNNLNYQLDLRGKNSLVILY